MKFEYRVPLATLALVAFLVSFAVARTYTTLLPNNVLIGGGLHIHHFWYGLILIAIGGWLGIAYTQKWIDIIAAVLYGAGGGLVIDEVGLLLTFGDYWSGLTWTFFVFILILAIVLILFFRNRQTIGEELGEFFKSIVSPYIGVFLILLSAAFLLETDNLLVTLISAILVAIGVAFLVLFFIQRLRSKNYNVQ